MAIVYPKIAGVAEGVIGSVIYSGASSGAPAPSASMVGSTVYLTDKPTAQGGWFVVRESSGTPGTYIYDRVGGGVIVEDTWNNCNLYNMTVYDGCTFRVTDIGAFGYDFVAAGGFLRPKNNAGSNIQIYSKSLTDVATAGYLLIGGSGGTYSQSGNIITVTLTGHTIPATEFDGCKVHLTISTGLAVTGWFTNFQRTGADTFTCVSSVSQSTSGNLGSNTSKTSTPWSYKIPSGIIKKLDYLSIGGYIRVKATAGSKTITCAYSGNDLPTTSQGNTANWIAWGLATQQFLTSDSQFITSATPAVLTDTDRTYTMSLTLSAATDWMFVLPNNVVWGPRYGL